MTVDATLQAALVEIFEAGTRMPVIQDPSRPVESAMLAAVADSGVGLACHLQGGRSVIDSRSELGPRTFRSSCSLKTGPKRAVWKSADESGLRIMKSSFILWKGSESAESALQALAGVERRDRRDEGRRQIRDVCELRLDGEAGRRKAASATALSESCRNTYELNVGSASAFHAVSPQKTSE